MAIDSIFITDELASVKIGSRAEVVTPVVEGQYRIYSRLLEGDFTREQIMAAEIDTENYLTWDVEVIDEP